MKISEIAKHVQKFTVDNSPLILTGIGVTGVVTTALLTGKAAFRASDILRDYEHEIREGQRRNLIPDLSLKEKVNLTWKFYIPPFLAGAASIAAVVGANQVGTRRSAALAAAFSLSEKSFSEYKEKVLERVGTQKEQSIRDDLAQERVNNNPVGTREVIITGQGDILCYDHFSGRYFESNMETLKKAQNDLNYRINNDGYASLTDFYDMIGLSQTSESEEVGWTSNKLMELDFSTVLSKEGKPCISIDFAVRPVRDYFRFH